MAEQTTIGQWVRSIWSESDGSGSSTRVHITAILALVIAVGIVFCVLVAHKTITVAEYDAYLSTAGIFVTATCGALYGLNKASEYLTGKS